MNNKKLLSSLDKTTAVLAVLTAFLIPLVFSPWTANIFDLNKTLVLGIVAVVMSVLWAVKNVVSKNIHVTVTPFTLPIVLVAVTMLIATFRGWISFLNGFANYTAPVFFLAIIFLMLTTAKLSKKVTEAILMALVASGVFLGIASVLESINAGPSRLIGSTLNINTTNAFVSPAGSIVALIAYLLPMLVIALAFAILHKKTSQKVFYFLSAAVLTAALVVGIFNILPGKPNTPTFLPVSVSWQVAVENIKNPRSLLVGVGPQNYLAAFSAFKPVSFNQYEFWNTRFNLSRNHLINVFTTTGILGLAAWAFLIVKAGKVAALGSKLSNEARLSLLGAVLLLIITLFIPFSLTIMTLFFMLLAVAALELKNAKDPLSKELVFNVQTMEVVESQDFQGSVAKDATSKNIALPVIFMVLVLLLGGFILYGGYRVYAADFAYRRSLVAASNNDGTNTYNYQRSAITLNPLSSLYRRSYATTNLQLANTLSQQGNLSDQDKQTVTTLISQAIREGRNAVLVEPTNPGNWETLANIYRSLINVAEGAQEWATTSYAQAIQRDPTNPRLRLELGGIFYQLKDYNAAIRLFEQAIQLKPDYANAHYNLAVTYKEAGQLEQAVRMYDNVLALVPPTSADYNKALEEQNALKEQLGQEATQAQEAEGELTTPSPLPTPAPEEELLDLGEEAAPPTSDELQESSTLPAQDDSSTASPSANPQ